MQVGVNGAAEQVPRDPGAAMHLGERRLNLLLIATSPGPGVETQQELHVPASRSSPTDAIEAIRSRRCLSSASPAPVIR